MIPVKRIVLWSLGTLSAVAMLFGYHTSLSGPLAATTPVAVTSGSSTASTVKSAASASTSTAHLSAASGSGSGSSSGGLTRTVTGSVVNTIWGPVQVQVHVAHGRIATVRILQYPHGTQQDLVIAQYALPILVHETEQAQSAHIAMVSGATYTSTGYVQSLQSALDQVQL